jgi:hypothetical protein
MIGSSLVVMPANLASSVETMGQQRPRKYRSSEFLITTIIPREASWQVNFVVDAFTQLDRFNWLHSRQDRKKVKSNVNCCSQLIFVCSQ